MKIPDGQTVRYRDIVVFGELDISTHSHEETSEKSSIVARNIICVRKPFDASVNVLVKCDRLLLAVDPSDFYRELERLIINHFDVQREFVKHMGLISILV